MAAHYYSISSGTTDENYVTFTNTGQRAYTHTLWIDTTGVKWNSEKPYIRRMCEVEDYTMLQLLKLKGRYMKKVLFWVAMATGIGAIAYLIYKKFFKK